MRPIELTVVEGGIQRLRTKGRASPRSLFDLVNGYLTADKKVRSRQGTFRVASLPAGTKGLCSFEGKLHVFSHTFVSVPAGFVCHVIRHPDGLDDDDAPIPILHVHFAEPFMGALYVVAEFDAPLSPAGTIFHYWLQGDVGDVWMAETEYRAGQLVGPTTPTGLFYKAGRLGEPHPKWSPQTPRAVSDTIEPTIYNDFYYEAVSVAGSNPRSGDGEPEWPESTGAQVVENVAGEPQESDVQPPEPPVEPQRKKKNRYTIRVGNV